MMTVIFQMQDMTESELRENRFTFNQNDGEGSLAQNVGGTGFVVKGAPWEQRAPDTASTSEFPSFGGGEETPRSIAPTGAWGARR